MCNRRILFAFLSGMIGTTCTDMQNPLLALRMDDYSAPPWALGAIFGVSAFLYVLGCLLLPYIIPTWVPHRVTLITGLYVFALSMSLIGPFFAPKNFVAMVVGFSLSGFFAGFLVIPLLPEMMQSCRQNYADCDLDHGYSLISAIFNASFGVGQALGPLYGSILYELVGFRAEFTATAAIVILFTTLYFACADGCGAFSELCVNFKMRKINNGEMENMSFNKTEKDWQQSQSARGSKQLATKRIRLNELRKRLSVDRALSEDRIADILGPSSLVGSQERDSLMTEHGSHRHAYNKMDSAPLDKISELNDSSSIEGYENGDGLLLKIDRGSFRRV